MNPLPQEKLERLYKALELLHRQYNPLARMLKVPFQSSGFLKFLRGLPVHPTRESLSYAVALLDTDNQKFHQRAENILQQVLSLQDQNSRSKAYGCWPKYLEEKPFKIVLLDKNWCDFLGTYLLQVVLNHRPKLSTTLLTQIDAATLHTARAIQRRNVPLEYTNIAIMGIYVTLITAQIYEIADLYDYAIARLRDFHDYVVEQGGFSEYNSPTYTIITLKVLGRLRLHATGMEAKKLIDVLYRLVWEEIAYHFHPPTRQWAGPHSRNYSTFLEEEVLALIDRSTSERINFGTAETYMALDEHWLSLPCPVDLEPHFQSLDEPRTTLQTLFQKTPPQTLTSYLAPLFSLGVVNYSDFWDQRRPLLAYWGDFGKSKYLRLRCLCNDVDFAAAQFYGVQNEGSVLAGVSFSKDIDPINPYENWNQIHDLTIPVKRLHLCFEFVGITEISVMEAQSLPIIDSKTGVCLYCDGLYFQIMIPYAQFGDTTGQWEILKQGDRAYLNVILFSGKERVFRFSELKRAAVGFALKITTENTPTSEVSINLLDDWLKMDWENLNLKIWTRPANQSSLNTCLLD